MELEDITNYINNKLRKQYGFKEQYYINSDSENNRIEIFSLYMFNELPDMLLKDINKSILLEKNLNEIIKSKDQNITDIDVCISICNDIIRGLIITKIRDPELPNFIKNLPNELLSEILSNLEPKEIKYFGTTCKYHTSFIKKSDFWMFKWNKDTDLNKGQMKLINNKSDNYKELYKCYYSFVKNEGILSLDIQIIKDLIMLKVFDVKEVKSFMNKYINRSINDIKEGNDYEAFIECLKYYGENIYPKDKLSKFKKLLRLK